MTEDRIDQIFPVETPAEFSLNTVSGHVTVRVHGENAIRVRAIKEGPEHARENTQIDVQQDGNRVSVTTHDESALSGIFREGRGLASVAYEIAVPAACAVQIKTVSADVSLTGVRERVSLQTVSGDAHIGDLAGAISVNTVSGDVVARQLQGTLTLHTTSGDARIIDSSLDEFNLHSVSGDFIIETPLVAGRHYYAKTVSGDLRIAVPENTGVSVQMRSVSGDVTSDLPNAEILRSGRRHWQGRINGGGASVEMQSVSGDLRITRGPGGASAPPPSASDVTAASASDMAPVPPVPPTPPAPAEPAAAPGTAGDTTAVLTLLEQGEINVEEALARLRGGAR